MKINETQLRQIIRESINEIRRKKQSKTGKIQNKEGKWVDATEDGQDKYGNPMYRTKDSSITYGRKCKDGSRRVQDFNFRPNVNESQLRKIIKESIKKVLNEEYGVDFQDTLAWVQKKNPGMSPEEQEKFARNIIRKREHDNYVFDMHMATSGGNDSFKRELTWDEAKRCYMKYGRYIDEISYKDKRYGPYAEWNEFNPKAFFDEDE